MGESEIFEFYRVTLTKEIMKKVLHKYLLKKNISVFIITPMRSFFNILSQIGKTENFAY